MILKRIGLRACAAEDLAIPVPSVTLPNNKPSSEDEPMKIEHETKAYFGDRAEAVDFATKALGNPANNRIWFSFHGFEAQDRKYTVTVQSEVET